MTTIGHLVVLVSIRRSTFKIALDVHQDKLATCYYRLSVTSERNVQNDNFSFSIYLCYLVYAPLYIAGPILSFNAFASQLDMPQKNYSLRGVAWYGLRWFFSLLLMELMTHLFYYNACAISGLWKQLSPMDVFIIGYGERYDFNILASLLLITMQHVLNFMWLKFFLSWRYFRYMYIPLGGSQRKLLNVWVIFTFVPIWHDLEWKLLSWAWLACVFFIPEMLVKSAAKSFQARENCGRRRDSNWVPGLGIRTGFRSRQISSLRNLEFEVLMP
ncbi:hypothetical protein TEA_017334 [Camellia sinensis var. sinensis]|uniref:Uncharacterized protein n=1 Tax=Camellia sinensis var. sinensis TaxID=542762 RepID=A0A4S4E817_CAMSN|nr:hypothetical protein TEA_017334 [Camellia sinensis var. sinensis]